MNANDKFKSVLKEAVVVYFTVQFLYSSGKIDEEYETPL